MRTGFSGAGDADGTRGGARPGGLFVGGGTVPTAGCTRLPGKRSGAGGGAGAG